MGRFAYSDGRLERDETKELVKVADSVGRAPGSTMPRSYGRGKREVVAGSGALYAAWHPDRKKLLAFLVRAEVGGPDLEPEVGREVGKQCTFQPVQPDAR